MNEEMNEPTCLVTFWFGTIVKLFCTTRTLVGHENTQRRMVHCHKGLQVYHFWVLYYCVCATGMSILPYESVSNNLWCHFQQCNWEIGST